MEYYTYPVASLFLNEIALMVDCPFFNKKSSLLSEGLVIFFNAHNHSGVLWMQTIPYTPKFKKKAKKKKLQMKNITCLILLV